MQKNPRLLVGLLLFVLLIAVAYRFTHDTPTPANQPSPQPTKSKQAFDKQRYSLNDPASPWAVVNKRRPLQPTDYAPSDLVMPRIPQRVPGSDSMRVRRAASSALETMFAAAKRDGIDLLLSSGFRSYQYQVNVYDRNVSAQGKEGADNVSARPGYSEHQTGLAADIADTSGQCVVETCFADRPAGMWLANNAHTYGFIIRYGKGLTPITGYAYEPWHVRFVGVELAAELRRTNQPTLERFFDLGDAPSY